MTDEQFARWEEFATRMAEHYPNETDSRRKEIAGNVRDFFEGRQYGGDWAQMEDWDGNSDTVCVSDEVDDFFDDIRPDEWEDDYIGSLFNQTVCCIRAGFDVAVKPSGGVIGFTAGDVRKMWDGKVPDWVKAFWDDFDGIQDDEGVWL